MATERGATGEAVILSPGPVEPCVWAQRLRRRFVSRDVSHSPSSRSLMAALTSPSSSSAVTAMLMSPIVAASREPKRSPRRKADWASARRILGRQTTEMTAGTTPTRTSVNPNIAVSMAIEMSMAAAMPTPPATQCPAMRPTNGFGERRMRCSSVPSWVALFESSFSGPVERSLRSAPAQKTLPRFVSTATRMSGSPSTRSMAATSSSRSFWLSAFRLSSSHSVIVITPSLMFVSTSAILSPCLRSVAGATGEGLGP